MQQAAAQPSFISTTTQPEDRLVVKHVPGSHHLHLDEVRKEGGMEACIKYNGTD